MSIYKTVEKIVAVVKKVIVCMDDNYIFPFFRSFSCSVRGPLERFVISFGTIYFWNNHGIVQLLDWQNLQHSSKTSNLRPHKSHRVTHLMWNTAVSLMNTEGALRTHHHTDHSLLILGWVLYRVKVLILARRKNIVKCFQSLGFWKK